MSVFKSIKFRLTVWYLVAIAVLLIVFGVVSYRLLRNNLFGNLDQSLRTRMTEIEASIRVVNGQIQFDEKVNDLVMIYNADGTLRQKLGPSVRFSHIEEIVQQALFCQESLLSASTTEGQEVRLYAKPHNIDSGTRVAIVVGRLLSDVREMLDIFRMNIINAALVVVLLAGAGGMFLAGRTLKPVEHMADTARAIGESDLSRRIDIQTEDELGHLAATLNGMIARLEEAFQKQRQFVADASHELRTPLAIIQAESSLALDRKRSQGEYRKSLELVNQEVAYMSDIVGKLLLLARSDAGFEPVVPQDVNITDLFSELALDVGAMAQEKGLQFSLGPAESLVVRGDRLKLRQLLLNVLDNAVRYTPSGGSVTASVTRRNGSAVVSVADTGVGIQAEHLPFIFDRFYRVDKVRSGGEGGTGLGLSIALTIAKMHGGTIEVESQPGKGTTFSVVLPLAESQAA